MARAPTLCPNVGATHWVALGRSCRRARSCPEQTNREAGLGNCGRRGASPGEGGACLAPTLCPNVGATHWVAPGRSCRRARSCSEQTNREARLGNCGRRRANGRPPDEGEAVPRPYIVSQRRGDPLGRPSVVHPDALVRARNKQIARRAWEIVGGACLAPTLCPNVGATHWVALGRSCRRARSCPEQTNREAGNCGRLGAPPGEGGACLAPTLCPNAGATHWVALWSFMPKRSFVPGTNKSRGGPGKLWATRGAAG